MILGGSDSSRPTSAITGSSSQSNKAGPKIHLKHVLRNILATSNGVHHENLLDRYVQQQSEYMWGGGDKCLASPPLNCKHPLFSLHT